MRTVSIKLSEGHYNIAPNNEKTAREWLEHEKHSNELWQAFLVTSPNTTAREQAKGEYLAESKAYWGW